MEIEALLAGADHVAVDRLRISPTLIEVELHCTLSSATCPLCGAVCRRVHSRYVRTVDDLPWCGTPVKMRWRARRFFCDEPTCRRRVFAEQLRDLAAHRGRSTARRDKALVAIGLEAGGEPGARLGRELGVVVSGDTLLRRLRRSAPAPAPRDATEIGIDDFALRRGQRYGTILVDHGSGRVLDLLPERSSETAAEWLRRHPSIALVTRDRADAYAKAVSEALPNAVQVADRWHLLANLREALVRLLDRRHCDVAAAAAEVLGAAAVDPPEPIEVAPSCTPASASPAEEASPSLSDESPPLKSDRAAAPASQDAPLTKADALSLQLRAKRLAKYERVRAMKAAGHSVRSIARQLRMGRDTVGKFLRAGSFPERARRRCKSSLDRHADVLRQMWDAGFCNARELHDRLRREHGYRRKYDSVRRMVQPWRELRRPAGAPKPGRRRTRRKLIRPPRVASRRLAWLLVREGEHEGPEGALERRLAETLLDRCVEIKSAVELARTFGSILRDRKLDVFARWTSRALQPEVAEEVRSFAEGLVRDWPCVIAALEHAHSNGRTEGHVNRLKLIKRKMYGRAKLDLLRIRVVGSR